MSNKILLVINDVGVKVACVRAMADLHGEEAVDAICVEDGRAALFQLNEILPDLLIAEIASGEKNGFVLCQYARQEPEFAGMRVLLLDDEANPVREKVAYDLGADAYLAPPFREEEIARVIRRLFGMEQQAAITEPAIAAAAGAPQAAPKPQSFTVAPPPVFHNGHQFHAPGQSALANRRSEVLPQAPPSRLRTYVLRPRYVTPGAILLALAGLVLMMRLYDPGGLTGQNQTQPAELGRGKISGAEAGAVLAPTQTLADQAAGAEAASAARAGGLPAAAAGGRVVREVDAAPSKSAPESVDAPARDAAATEGVAPPAAGARQTVADDGARLQPADTRARANSAQPATAGSHLRRSGREMKQAGKHIAGGVKHFGLSGAKAANKVGKKVGHAFKKIF